MRKLIYSLLWAVCGMSAAPAQAQHAFRVMEYNVENLFDCRHDSLKQDTEFLPGSVRNWTYSRFQDKVNKIGKVILAAGKEQVPDLVGLCEVENDYCLKSLTCYSPLREVGYKYVMTSSPDERGIDVALLYQPVSFRLLASQKMRIPSDSLGMRPTRGCAVCIGTCGKRRYAGCLCLSSSLACGRRKENRPLSFVGGSQNPSGR